MTCEPPPKHPVQLHANLIGATGEASGVRFGVAGARVVDVTGLTRAEAEAVTQPRLPKSTLLQRNRCSKTCSRKLSNK